MDDTAPLSPRTEKQLEELGFFGNLFKHGWKPTSAELLKDTEAIMLEVLKTPYEQFLVQIDDKTQINTLKVGSGPPLVMVHGYGGGLGIWIGNLDFFAKHYTIYAIDLLGFGRSSRTPFTGESHTDAQNFFLDSFEKWRAKMGLEKFALFGHSLGAYLVGIYTYLHPQRVNHLLLIDAWGVPLKPEGQDPRLKNASFTFKLVASAANYISSPFSLLRAAGPYGPALVDWARPDLANKFQHLLKDPSTFGKYVYHCNAQEASGDMAFSALQIPVGWARDPLVTYLPKISQDIPISFIYGRKTWMDVTTAARTMEIMSGFVEMALIPNAGHHVYVDNQEYFNQAVILCLQRRLHELPNFYPDIDYRGKPTTTASPTSPSSVSTASTQ